MKEATLTSGTVVIMITSGQNIPNNFRNTQISTTSTSSNSRRILSSSPSTLGIWMTITIILTLQNKWNKIRGARVANMTILPKIYQIGERKRTSRSQRSPWSKSSQSSLTATNRRLSITATSKILINNNNSLSIIASNHMSSITNMITVSLNSNIKATSRNTIIKTRATRIMASSISSCSRAMVTAIPTKSTTPNISSMITKRNSRAKFPPSLLQAMAADMITCIRASATLALDKTAMAKGKTAMVMDKRWLMTTVPYSNPKLVRSQTMITAGAATAAQATTLTQVVII